jgi:hypothetical protein
MKNIFCLSVLLASFLLSPHYLFAQLKAVDTSNVQTLRIDPSSAMGAPASELFDEIKYIPLETTKESTFGDVHRLRFVDNHYIIFDYDTRAILIFTAEGKYVSKITKSKMPVEKDSKKDNEVYYFDIEEDNGKNLIMVYGPNSQLLFDLSGNYVKKRVVKEDEQTKIYLGNNTDSFIRGYTKNKKDTINYSFAFLNGDSVLSTYLPYNTKRYQNDQYFSTSGDNPSFADSKKEFWFTDYYSYNVYKGKANSLALAYRFVFPMNMTLPNGFLEDAKYKNKRMDYFRDHTEHVYALGNVREVHNKLYFTTASWSSSAKSNLCYDFATGGLTSLTDIEPDKLSQFLPINDSGMGFSFSGRGFSLYQGGYFFTSCSSLAMFKFKEQSADKKPTYTPELANYFKTQSAKSNPVLILLKPKKN